MRVGKSVLYSPVGGEQHFGLKLAALVTFVHENGTLNLAIFDPYGNLVQNPPTNIDPARVTTSATAPVAPVVSDVGPTLADMAKQDAIKGLPAGVKLGSVREATSEEIKPKRRARRVTK